MNFRDQLLRGSDLFAPARNSAPARADWYRGAHTDRQRRFDARAARRSGDWFILDMPRPIVWFDDPYVPLAYVPGDWWGETILIDPWS